MEAEQLGSDLVFWKEACWTGGRVGKRFIKSWSKKRHARKKGRRAEVRYRVGVRRGEGGELSPSEEEEKGGTLQEC